MSDEEIPLSVEEETAAIPRSDRNQDMLEVIEARNRARLQQEIAGEALGIDPDPDPDPGPELDEMIEIRVFPKDPDGFVGQVKRSEVEEAGGVEVYSKQVAANIKMRRAEGAENTLQQEREQIAAERAELARLREEIAARPPEPAPERPGDDGLTEAQRTRLKELQDEYPDEFVDQERRVMRLENQTNPAPERRSASDPGNGAEPPLDEAKAREIAREEAAYRDEVAEIDTATKHFSEHFSHLETDPKLRGQVQDEIKAIRKANPSMSWVDVAQKAGENIDAWVKGFSGGAKKGAQDADPFKETRKRKRTISSSPRGAGTRAAKTSDEPAPLTNSEKVQQMAAQRPGGFTPGEGRHRR